MGSTSQCDLNAMTHLIARFHASKSGSSPFFAMLMAESRVLMTAQNKTSLGDPTAHAEMEVLRQAFKANPTIDTRRCTLYTTCEPCPMCLSACFYGGLRRVVYGVSIDFVRTLASGDAPLSACQLNSIAGFEIRLVQVMREEFESEFHAYFLRHGRV